VRTQKTLVHPEPSELRLLYRVATAYYEDDRTQEEIAERLGLSRVKVCRLLDRARSVGIVRISVNIPGSGSVEQERALERRFGLLEAVVAPRTPRLALVDRLGAAAAELFTRTIRGHEVVGLTWGNALRAFVGALPRLHLPELKIVQIIGGLGSVDAGVNGVELTRALAERCGARPRLLHAPGIVATPEVKAALVADNQVREALELGARAEVVIVGIGVPLKTFALLGPGPLLPEAELDALLALGAVGDIAFRHFDARGQMLETGLEGRVVGLEPALLAAVPRRIAVAGGPEKTDAIRAALTGQLVNVLVTDEDTAAALLA